MADNVLYTQGTGTSIATDDVSGIHFQKMKMDVGKDGTSLQPDGSIPVYIVSGTGAYLMNDPFVDAVAIAGQLDDTGTTLATENNIAPIRITASRALHVFLASGIAAIDMSTKSVSVVTSVAFSATNVTILSSNTAREMAMLYNDVDRAAYVKLGATATTSSFTVKLLPGAYYELPLPCYTGIIDALWDAGGTGSMRITEIS